ncbi:retrovirus-related pol polyprotein from transposon TNT 1-94 [Tanacetum coccineum]
MSMRDYLKRSVWYLDSGCSRHMTGVKQYLHRYTKEPGPKVVFGDDSLGDTEGYGSVNCNGITFTRVAYVNGLKHNLISISQLCDANFKVLFTKTRGTIFNQKDEVVLIAPRRRDVYVIDMSSFNKDSNPSFEKGKHHKASFKTKRSFSISKSLYLLHMDLFGPIKPQTTSHNKYTLVIVDEYSRKMENLNEVRVKELRSDNGTEFRNHKLKEFYDKNAARTMLNSAKLSKQFWGEAVNTACYIQNRSIKVKRHGKTAYDVFRGRSLDISYFHVFGCPVHIQNHKDHLGKFDENADDGFFLGYSPVAKAFRVFNIRRQEMEETVHVTFSEDNEAISQTSIEGDNSVTSEEPPEVTIADDLLNTHEHDHVESADILEFAEPQDNVLSESISGDQPAPIILLSTEVILQNPVPQDR